jgi:hypothetical protein
MPLFEVHQKYLKFKSEHEIYRFIHDPKSRITVHIWQDKQIAQMNPADGISRFQVAIDNQILEWKNNRISYGEVDTGDEGFGIKKSPIMMMTDKINIEFIKKVVPVLSQHPEIPGIKFIVELLEKG